MSASLASLAWCVTLACAVATCGDELDAGSSEPDQSASALASELVRAALQMGADGDVVWRNAMLQEALENDPACALARWHLGQIRFEDEWLTREQVEDFYRGDPRTAEYRKVREALAETPGRELVLARWCQDSQLSDEARFHWLNVLMEQPHHAEALRALDAQWYQGELLGRGDVAERKREDLRFARRTSTTLSARKRRWEEKARHWEMVAVEKGALLALMEADLAGEAKWGIEIPLISDILARRTGISKDREVREHVSLTWVEFLSRDPALTKYLVMQAIGHPWESVRIAASEHLKSRPRETYVPLLLACGRLPVEFACSVLAAGGLSSVQFQLNIEGLESDTLLEHQHSLLRVAPLDVLMPSFDHGDTLLVSGGETAVQAAQQAAWRSKAYLNARHIKMDVDRYNALSDVVNRRVAEALARATGENFQADPRVWQAWWKEYLCDYFELEQDPRGSGQSAGGLTTRNEQRPAGDGHLHRPQQTVTSTFQQFIVAPPSQVTRLAGVFQGPSETGRPAGYRLLGRGWPGWSTNAGHLDFTLVLDAGLRRRLRSCFDGATPVWTSTGRRPIAEVLPGDRVLSQCPRTGELAYQMVRQVTKRDPCAMLRITAGGEQIVATLGHPFWVIGKRWVMAKHLQQGDLLHSLSGPVLVEQLEEIPAPQEWFAFSYNLEVDGFRTFFVGDSRLLVHQLSMLSVLDEGASLVPGL